MTYYSTISPGVHLSEHNKRDYVNAILSGDVTPDYDSFLFKLSSQSLTQLSTRLKALARSADAEEKHGLWSRFSVSAFKCDAVLHLRAKHAGSEQTEMFINDQGGR